MASADPNKLKVIKQLGRNDVLFAVARVPGTNRLFVGSSDFKVHDVDLGQAKPVPRAFAGHKSYVTGLALAGKTLVSGGYDGRLIWWDTDKSIQLHAADAHTRWIRRVVATPDGKVIASVADDMVCRLWDPAGKMIRELRGHKEMTPHHYPSMLYACAASPDSRFLATGDKVGHIVIWEIASGKQVTTLEAPVMYTWDPVQRRHSIGGIRSLAFSPDGKMLAVGGMGKVNNIDHLEGKARVEVFDWQKGQRTHEFPGDRFNGLVEQLHFHPQGAWLLGGGGAGNGFLLFFNLKDKKTIRQEKVAMNIHDFALNEASDTIFAVGHGKIMVFEMKG